MPTPYEVEQALNAELEQVTAAQERAILAAWAAAWSELSSELFDTLLDLLAGGARITAATVVRSERLATSLAQVADRLEDLAADAGLAITSDLDDVVERGIDGTRRLIAAQLEDDRGRVRDRRFDPARWPAARVLDAIVARTTEQITSTLLPVADETYAIIQRELIRGVAVGDNPRETARRMVDRAEDHWNFGRSRAVTIARTETLDAYRAASEESQRTHATLLAGWLWLAHLGPRTCRSCLAMHGQLFPLEKAGPDDHQQGRCARCPVVAPADGSDPDLSWVPDAEAHFASLDRGDQVALLGRKGHQAWAAGDFPIESWTKTRTTDGWRDSQVPAAPGDSAGGSGRNDGPPRRPPAPPSDDDSHRTRAIAQLGAPPASDTAGYRSYWAARQDLLPTDFQGDQLLPHEVEFVERFLDAGERLTWIPRSPGTSTHDFFWSTRNSIPVELKSTKARAATIRGRILDAASRALLNHGVVKENFVIDLGDQPITDALLEDLAAYNVGRRKYQIKRLWLMSGGRLQEIELLGDVTRGTDPRVTEACPSPPRLPLLSGFWAA